MLATIRAATRAYRAGVGPYYGTLLAMDMLALAEEQAYRRATDSVTTEAAPRRDSAGVPKTSGELVAGNVSRTGSGHVDYETS